MYAIIDLLRMYELPVSTEFNAADLAGACLADKKREGDDVTLIFPAEIGRCLMKKIPVDELETVISLGLS